ncbi:MAG: hypothetical protein ACD_59C00088G0003, partial [uncultured bacterium]
MIKTVKKIKSDKLMKRAVAVFICAVFIFNFLSAAYAGVITRIKDIARIGGVRENQLVGYG